MRSSFLPLVDHRITAFCSFLVGITLRIRREFFFSFYLFGFQQTMRYDSHLLIFVTNLMAFFFLHFFSSVLILELPKFGFEKKITY